VRSVRFPTAGLSRHAFGFGWKGTIPAHLNTEVALLLRKAVLAPLHQAQSAEQLVDNLVRQGTFWEMVGNHWLLGTKFATQIESRLDKECEKLL
jgi:hypothetical protein